MANKCNWRLEAISKAANNRKKTTFVLKAGENTVGKRKDNHIKIPSALCSRDHCSIFLDGDAVTVKDISRNGTYITFAGDIGTKHYTNATTEQPLGENDIISFGFNTASIYDVNDKNAFIYRLVKEVIETIDIDDSDDETEATVPQIRGKIIEITNKVIDVPSDSDSNYSGDECFRNIDEMEHEEEEEDSNPSVQSIDDSVDDEYNDSIESEIESDEDGFVVTKTIMKCPTPTETISLDDDDAESEKIVEEKSVPEKFTDDDIPNSLESEKCNEKDMNGAMENASTSKSENDEKSNDSNKKINESDKSTETGKTEELTSIEHQVEPSSSSGSKANLAEDENARLVKLKRRLADKTPRTTTTIKPQPLKKRRKTITEHEYNQRKQAKKMNTEQSKLIRKQHLAELGNKEKAKREAAAENAIESHRIPFVPKVKNCSVSRAEQLCTDFLALN